MKFLPFFGAALASSAAFLLPSTGFAAEATTDPVGFITLNVNGATAGSPRLSLISPTLTRPVVWQGTVTSVSSSGNSSTLTVAANSWSDDQFNGANGAHYVEISSATKAGALADIADTTTSSLITGENVSTHAAVGDTIRIRRHITLSELFGANNAFGLAGTDDASTADEVLVYNGGSYGVYFYYIGDPGNPAGWYTAEGSPAGNTIIGPNDGIVVRRKAAGNRAITFAGAVKTGNTKFPIVPGLNVIGTVSASGLTLDNSGLFQSDNSALTATDDASTADEVVIYSAGVPQAFFRYTGDPQNPAGWYSAEGAPAGSTAIPAGSSLVIRRKSGGSFNWILPAPATF